MRTILDRLRGVTAGRLAWVLAAATALCHVAIESEAFSNGPLSRRGMVHGLDMQLLDGAFRARRAQLAPTQVSIAAIDEASVAHYGLWPWPRTVIADFIAAAHAAGARAIAFDAVFSDVDRGSNVAAWERMATSLSAMLPPSDAAAWLATQRQREAAASPDARLAAAIAAAPQTVLGYFDFYRADEVVDVDAATARADLTALAAGGLRTAMVPSVREMGGREVEVLVPSATPVAALAVPAAVGARAPLPALRAVARHFGYFNVTPDPDGPIRRLRLLDRHDDALLPALALATAAVATDGGAQPLVRDGRLDGVRLASGVTVPCDARGRMWINYEADPEQRFPVHSVADIVAGRVPPGVLAGRVVLFGMTAQGLFDLRPTPFAATTPGVYVHATALQNMLDGHFLRRPFGTALVEALAYLVFGAALGALLPRLGAWGGAALVAASLVLLHGVARHVLLSAGIWTPTVLPTLQAVATLAAVTWRGYLHAGAERRRLRAAFTQYVAADVVAEVLRDPSKLALGGERRECTVLFSDVRGFTRISEGLSPEALVALLNGYLTPMTDVILAHAGTLDKYMGDAIMALFGAPLASKRHAAQACTCALAMRRALAALQAGWRAAGTPVLEMGIGLSSGAMSVGNMGSSTRFDYTAMGDYVNLGARIEGLTKDYGAPIMISENTYRAVHGGATGLHARAVDVVQVKGKSVPTTVYELLGEGAATPADAALIAACQAGLIAYGAGDFVAATAAYEAAQEARPGDPVAALFLRRCAASRASPPQGAWDGVTRLDHK